jgi:hypothetical protein
MSLFHRRSIQKMLNHCSHFLSKRQLESFVEKLNLENKESLISQWELGVLYALNSSGIIEHETDFKKRPDIRWIARNLSCEFIADIRTLSDEGYEAENPREFYRHELGRQIRAIGGLDTSFFRDEPNYKMDGEDYSDRRVKLLYPPVNEYRRLFNQDFLDFVQRIKTNRPLNDSIRLQGKDFDVTIIYQVQNGKYRIGGGNVSYTIPFSLKRNPIYRALQEKREQLKGAKYSGIKGIILTDGGCHALSTKFSNYTGQTYSDERIILKFLKGTKTISFVMTIYCTRDQKLYNPMEPLKIKAKLFTNAHARVPLPEICKNALLEIPRYMPIPKLNGNNAARHLKSGRDNHEKAWYEGTKIESSTLMTKVFISSRSLADLLAQRITPEKFSEINNLNSPKGNLFNLWLTQGFGISHASFEKKEDRDDDHIVLTYEPDFSLKKYEVPKQRMRRLFFRLWQKTKYFPREVMNKPFKAKK